MGKHVTLEVEEPELSNSGDPGDWDPPHLVLDVASTLTPIQ